MFSHQAAIKPNPLSLVTRAVPTIFQYLAFLALFCCLMPISNATSTDAERITLFAFDNHMIPHVQNLKLEMNKPVKYSGNPVVARGEPGTADDYGVQFYGSVVREEDKFRLWYVAVDRNLLKWATPERNYEIWRPAYAESEDGIHWTKPNLGLVEYQGNTNNNLIKMNPGPLGIINLKVLREPHDPNPDHRYKITTQTWWVNADGKGGRGTLAPFYSSDGTTWNIVKGAEPVDGRMKVENMFLPLHHYEAGSGLYNWKGIYYITGQSNSGHFQHGTTPYSGREVLIHRSADFENWEPTAHVSFVREGQYKSFKYGEGEETHEGLSVWHRNNVLLGISGVWHGGADWPDRTIELGFLISNDGIHYREPMTEWKILDMGADGEWDQGGLLQGQGFENVGDQTYIYYGAWDPRPGGSYPPRGGVGLAILPRDRFGSLSMREAGKPAQFVTAEVSVKECSTPQFYLNADGLGKDATLRFELLDAREQPVAGFSGDDAAIVSENGFNTKIGFAAEADCCTLPDSIRLRVHFEGSAADNIELSAIYVATD